MVAGPVSSGMVSGTTPMLARAEASSTSSTWVRASAGCAFSIASAEVSSNMLPPTWKLASEMLKNSSSFRPSNAQTAMTANEVNEAVTMVRRRKSSENPCV